jgi:putative metallohydrolase (TIGR04338 family)
MLLYVMECAAEGSVDYGRSAVYAAEDQWSRQLDRGGVVNYFGSHLSLTQQQSFGSLEEAQAYLWWVSQQLKEVGWNVEPPRVRARRGMMAAHYERATRTIALPVQVTWALREAVLLHELTHHIVDGQVPAHGAQYRSTMLKIVSLVMGEEAAALLSAAYRGVQLT